MSRYIDADKLQQAYKEIHGGKRSLLIDTEPTADVRENVRGNWIKRVDHLDYGLIEFEGFECSACGFRIWKDDYENIEFKFCPYCGADMRPITALSKNAEIVAKCGDKQLNMIGQPLPKFCSNCGADMRGGESSE